jgi:4-amino-4-deoxy-L-arabinose transferase-like glycosyltransferase
MNHLRQKLYIAIFIVSLFLRLSLALVNRQANDNHMQAVNMIMATHQLPNAYDCRECFHPKLFYFTMALILQSLNITENDAQIVFTQVIDFLAGMMTLAVVWKFIEEYPSESSRVKLTAFALVALNPKLIAINSQASNDSFVILFCTLALFFTYRLIKAPSNKIFWAVVIFILLAMSTKATGWLIFIAVFFSLLLTHLVAGKEAGITPIRLSVFLISVLFFTTLNPLSQIVSNYKMFGAPITISDRSLPLPSLFEKSYPTEKYIFRPGILSIQDGFLTFKLFDLLSYPLTTNGPSDYPPFRTSFWTMFPELALILANTQPG